MTADELKDLLKQTVETVKEELEKAYKEKDEERQKELEAYREEVEKQLEEMRQPAEKKDVGGDADADPKAGYKRLGEFAKELIDYARTGRPAERLQKLMKKAAGDGMNETTDSEGAVLVPEEFAAQLLQIGVEKAQFLSRCTEVPMQTNSITIPFIQDTDRSGGYIHGSVMVYRKAEEAQASESKPKFGRVRLTLTKLIGLAYASDEIIEDSPISIEPILTQAFGDALAWQTDYEFINGSGSGEPLGILNAPALVTVSKETGQAAATIVYENIVKMYSRLPAASRQKAVWVANNDCIPQLYTMSLSVGTGGAPVFMPANGAAGQPYDTLFGLPIIYSEHCQTVGTKGDILLVDFTQYLHGVKAGAGTKTATSVHLKFDYDQTAFKFVLRNDGQPWWPGALTPRNSSNTLSPYVALETRS